MTRAPAYNRDDALKAAQDLFWEKGFHATSLKDLEHVLKMKPGSIYAAFDSKENLYLLAIERYFEQSKTELRAAMAAGSSPLSVLADQLRRFARDCQDLTGQRSCMLIKTVLEVTEANTAVSEQARKYLDAIREEFRDMFTAAQAQGELSPDADLDYLALRYQAAVTSLRIEAHRGTDPAVLMALAEDHAQWVEALRQV